MDKALSGDLLLHGLSHTTIGAAAFHFRVRDGIGWFHSAMFAEQAVETAQYSAPVSHGVLGRNKSFWLESLRVTEALRSNLELYGQAARIISSG